MGKKVDLFLSFPSCLVVLAFDSFAILFICRLVKEGGRRKEEEETKWRKKKGQCKRGGE
jgi:hypothetical protein